jgi:plasmid maintenance system antidote protein VapI
MTRITTHPGEILREEFMVPYGMSASALARALDAPVNRITEIIPTVTPVLAVTGHIRVGGWRASCTAPFPNRFLM